jgi:hypothetical protein
VIAFFFSGRLNSMVNTPFALLVRISMVSPGNLFSILYQDQVCRCHGADSLA